MAIYKDANVNYESEDFPGVVFASGDTGWSAGTLPNGISNLTPHQTMGPAGINVSYHLRVSAYPVVIQEISSPEITGVGLTVHSYSYRIVNAEATNSYPAIAEMEFNLSYTQSGVNPGSMVGYLRTELNSSGQVRLSWTY